uniref:protein-L-isoaspartate(D-aspartate) O-methyltransferase n=1 Tax=Ningiella ruwaisensis TaxID=2364274 RepID=UPI003BAB05DE
MILKPTRKGLQLAQVLEKEGISNRRVLDTIASTPREHFIPDALKHKAYENTALPIGQGQTISQPYIVARMTELLLAQDVAPMHILEIGTGSGYQTAILTQLFKQVFSVERIKTLQFQAKRRLNQLDLHNVKMKHGDGWQGWASKAPYDAIIVTAAAKEVPQALIAQLSEHGRMVIPVGEGSQQLLCIDNKKEQRSQTSVETVKFVPLIAGELA